MGKINGEKSDCCLRNLRNTCTCVCVCVCVCEREREKEREREREREGRSTLCTIFKQAYNYSFSPHSLFFGERMDISLRERWSVEQTPQNRLNFAVFRKSQNLSIATLLYSICEPVQHEKESLDKI